MIDQMGQFTTATLYEVLGESNLVDPCIKALVPAMQVCGRAFTVRCRRSDSLAILKALEMAQPGDVLVADAEDSIYSTVWGGTSAREAKTKGLAGFITNGAVRDYHELVEIGFGVFCRGVYAKGTIKEFPGEFGEPVRIGGVNIHNGDVIVGDADGIVRIPADRVDQVLVLAREQRKKERERDQRIEEGWSLLEIVTGRQAPRVEPLK